MKTRESGLPFDDIRALLADLPGANVDMAKHTAAKVAESMGEDAGKFGELCVWYSTWSGRSPIITKPALTLFAGTHAVDGSENEWLFKRVGAIASGGSSVNRLCQAHDLGLKLLDLALQIPVADITRDAALDEKASAGTLAFGMEAIAGGTDLLCVAAIEQGANASVISILSLLLEMSCENIATAFASPAEQIAPARLAADRVEKHKNDPLEVFRHLGGRETSAICGAILAARTQHIPVILAGPTALASAVVLSLAMPGSVAHCCYAKGRGLGVLDDKFSKVGFGSIVEGDFSSDPTVQAIVAASLMRSASLVLAESKD